MKMECVPGLRASLIKDGECNHVFEGMDLSAARRLSACGVCAALSSLAWLR